MSRFLPIFRFLLILPVFASLVLPSPAQSDRGEGQLNTAAPRGITPEEIIHRFAAKERDFAQARERYTYKESVTVQTVEGDTVDGEYRQSWDVNFDNQGN